MSAQPEKKPAKRGRKPMLSNPISRHINMEPTQFATAESLGNGSMSEGVRVALDCASQLTPALLEKAKTIGNGDIGKGIMQALKAYSK